MSLQSAVRCVRCWRFLLPFDYRCDCGSANLLDREWLMISMMGEIVTARQRSLW